MKVALVSANPGKARELRALLPEWEIEPLETMDIREETGETFYENALGKARFGRSRAPAGTWTLGEDSGLEVEGLAGAPGIRSARFGGVFTSDEENVVKLLAALDGVGGEGRRARYVSELVLLSPQTEEYRGRGTLAGRIASEPHGNAGFGYDPVFIPAGETETVAALGDSWKARNSHRARAAQALAYELKGAHRGE